MKDEKYFRGVFAINMLPRKMKHNECGIINFDPIDQPGSHWVAYYNNEYFDSFGLPPPQEIENYLKTSGKDIYYNSSQLQKANSVLCGDYCIHFIKKRNIGISYYDILYRFHQQPSNFNEINARIY